MAPWAGPGDLPAMDPDATVAEALPRLYRHVLDALERLERLGGRRDAARLRSTAIAVYSGSWDARSQRRLEDVLTRIDAASRERERRSELRVA
jgi:hypothetical protein